MNQALKIILAIAILSSCAVEPPTISTWTQAMRCTNCDNTLTYEEAMDAMGDYVSQTYAGSQRVTAGCDSVEIGGAVGYSCYVGFDFLGHRYTAQCTVWDNTSGGGATGVSGCDIVEN